MAPSSAASASSSSAATSSSQALPALPFNPARLRSYILRLPLFTRISLLVIAVAWLGSLLPFIDLLGWGDLRPSAMHLTT
ncbi:Glycosyl phosphatidyl inositol protein transamidase complex subunit, partial [Ascosphaera acerosa]